MKSESGFLMLLSVTAVVCAHISVSTTPSNSQEFFQSLIDLSRNETRRLEDYVSVLEQRLNDINVALDLKINKSEQEIIKLRNELQQEKSMRSGLQRQTDDLTMQLFDMAAKYTSMAARMNALEAHATVLNGSICNLTKTFSRVDVSKLKDDHVQLLELKQKQGYHLAFTATAPISGPVSGSLSFNASVSYQSNTGGHFNLTTGQFTSSIEGLFYFSLTIIKEPMADHAWCYIRKDGVNQVQAGTDPPTNAELGYYTASNVVVLHLQSGDRVDLGDCSPADTMSTDTTFTGFLLKVF